GLGGDGALQRERRDLTERVDAGVGAARADHGHIAIVERARRVFEQTLNRRAGRLPLPADEVGAVVGDRHPEAGHQGYITTMDTKDTKSKHSLCPWCPWW